MFIYKLICVFNCNNVFIDFFNIGIYDKNCEFFLMSLLFMDILVLSNLEWFFFYLIGLDVMVIVKLMIDL